MCEQKMVVDWGTKIRPLDRKIEDLAYIDGIVMENKLQTECSGVCNSKSKNCGPAAPVCTKIMSCDISIVPEYAPGTAGPRKIIVITVDCTCSCRCRRFSFSPPQYYFDDLFFAYRSGVMVGNKVEGNNLAPVFVDQGPILSLRFPRNAGSSLRQIYSH